ncbi:OmpA family protein [Magnetovibrio sp.]|uniref:OmpA family protein n=1 Tax=Magnetovibrio sp. TaxID=2024836 RepID=UPI002F94AB62
MDNRRLKPMFKTRRALSRDGLRYGVCMLALGGVLGGALGFASAAAAQDNPIVDLTDPNVSIDLSVLNDGGLSPQMGAPMPSVGATTLPGGAAYQAPGKDMPVSTLYVKPSSNFKLPPQTKSIETQFLPMPEREPVATPEPVETAAAEPVAEPVAPPAPAVMPPAAPAMAPVEVASAPPPAAQKPAVPEPATAEPVAAEPVAQQPASPEPQVAVQPEPAPQPTPEPAQTVAALTPTPANEPASAPQSPPMELKAEPAPEPTAATTPAPPSAPAPAPAASPVVEHDETQTAPSTGNAVVVPLPPQPDSPAQVASLPPASGPLSDGDSLRVVFDSETSKLSQSARDALLDIATKMKNQDNLRLQLLAYAGTADTSASAARRLSLSRALAVRSFLIENGVRSTRIDVRALGNKSTDEVTERVDITVVER